jgi:hypothetical protein
LFFVPLVRKKGILSLSADARTQDLMGYENTHPSKQHALGDTVISSRLKENPASTVEIVKGRKYPNKDCSVFEQTVIGKHSKEVEQTLLIRAMSEQ